MMNSLNGLMNDLLAAGLWIGAAVLVLVIVAAFKFSLNKKPPDDDAPTQ